MSGLNPHMDKLIKGTLLTTDHNKKFSTPGLTRHWTMWYLI